MNSQRRNRSNQKKSKRNKNRPYNIARMPMQRYYTSKDGHVVAPETITSLDYMEVDSLSNPASVNYAYAWHTNDAYDIYPGTGGASLIGYNLWSDFYTNFRVISYIVDLELSNQEAFPVMFYCVNSTQDASGAPANMINASAGPLSFSRMLAPVGTTGSYHKFRISHTISKVVGSTAVFTADNFMGTTDGNLRVADKTYITLGVGSTTASTLVNGVTYKLRMRMKIKFYARKALST